MKMRGLFLLLMGCCSLLAGISAHAQDLKFVSGDLDFGCVPVGDTVWLRVEVSNRENRPAMMSYRPRDPRGGPPSPFILPPLRDGRVEIPGRSTRADMIGFAPRIPSQAGWELRLELVVGDKKHDEIKLRGVSSPPRLPILFPDSLTSVIPAGDTALLCVRIANPSCRHLIIDHIILPDPNAYRLVAPSTPDTLSPRAEEEICIEFTPIAGTATNSVIRIALHDGRFVELPFEWKRPAYQVRVIPRGLLLDSTLVNTQSAEDTLALVNMGNAAVTLTAWQLLGRNPDEFLVDPPPMQKILRPNGLDTTFFRVRFAPRAAGMRTAELRLEFGDTEHPMLIPIRGVGTTGGVLVSPQEIDLGRVVIGDSVVERGRLMIQNNSGAPVEVMEIRLAGDDPSMFKVIGPQPASIPAGGTATYDVQFKPDVARPFAADAIVKLRTGPEVTVRLLGRGAEREHHFDIRLDSATADVNNRFPIHVFIDPPLTGDEKITSFTATIRLDPFALYPHGVLGTNAGNATITYLSSDTIRIERQVDASMTGGELFALELEGLVTGQPYNIVELIDLELGTNVQTTIAGNSVVQLNGCTVGSDFGKPVTVHSIYPAPASESATVRYTAPAGSQPSIRVLDITGRVVGNAELPAGSGAEQKATVGVDRLAPGVYFIEMRSGTERAVAPVVVRR